MTAAAPTALRALIDTDFDAAVGVPGGVLVLFTARWCAPCDRAVADAPATADAARRHGIAGPVQADIDAAPMAAIAAGITGVPCLVLYRAGTPAAHLTGHWPRQRVADWLNDALKQEG